MDIFQTSESACVVPSDALAFDLRRERAGDQNVCRLFVPECLLGLQPQAGHVVHCSSLGCCVHSVVYVCFRYGMTKYTYAELLWHRNNIVILRWKMIFQFQLYRTKKRPTKRVSRVEKRMQRPGPSADPSGSPKGRQIQNAQARKTEPQKVCWQNGSPKTFMF